MAEWTFITNHGAVLTLIAQYGQITAKEIAETLQMTERPVRRIIAELEAAGYLQKQRVGRTNRYQVRHDLPLRRSMPHEVAVGDLLRLLTRDGPQEADVALVDPTSSQ